MTKSTLVDVEVFLHHETKPDTPDEGAVLVSLDGVRKAAVWVPKSACQIENKSGGVCVLTLGEAMAIDKGLV